MSTRMERAKYTRTLARCVVSASVLLTVALVYFAIRGGWNTGPAVPVVAAEVVAQSPVAPAAKPDLKPKPRKGAGHD